MKLSDFRKLEQSIVERDFNSSYKTINIVMFVLSIFGHFTSIFLAYFLLSKILTGAIIDNPTLVFFSSVIILSAIELLKRDIFNKFSFQYLKLKSLVSKDVLPLFIVAFLIIGISFYSSTKGAAEFSSKSEELEDNKKELVQIFTDSVSKIYNTKIVDIEKEIKENKSKIDLKDKEQTELESVQPLTPQQRNRVRDLKREKTEIKLDNSKLENDITSIKSEMDTEIKKYEEKITLETDSKKSDNTQNSLMFIIISIMIELSILIGVYFNNYYRFRSYSEFKNKIDRDPNYQKWILYNSMLEVIYTKDTKVNDRLPTNTSIVDMCKINDVIILPKDLSEFMKLSVSLGIIRVSGSARYISKGEEISKELLKEHFNIK